MVRKRTETEQQIGGMWGGGVETAGQEVLQMTSGDQGGEDILWS